MIKEAIDRVLQLATPNIQKFGDLSYTDKNLTLIAPPDTDAVACSTLQGLVDLFDKGLDQVKAEDVLCHVVSPTKVNLISVQSDEYGRRRTWAKAAYPECQTFPFGTWSDPENFIIKAQQHFQRVKIENDDGTFAKDLDYILQVASKISAEHATEHEDDGFTQRVAVRQGAVLKTETILKPMVMLAPYRTFAEIDQVVSRFVFRCNVNQGQVKLALFEGDGGRWKIDAAYTIKTWLTTEMPKVAVIS